MKNTIKKIYLLSIAVVLVPLFVIAAASLLGKDREVSEKERRELAQKPKFTFRSIFDGSYETAFEKYYSDQFPMRDFLISANGRRENIFSGLRSRDDGIVVIKNMSEDAEKADDNTDKPSPDAASSDTVQEPEDKTGDAKENGWEKYDEADVYGYTILSGKSAMEVYDNSYKKLGEYAAVINRLADRLPDTKVYNVLIPSAIEFYAPAEYNQSKQKSQKQGIEYVYERLTDATGVDVYGNISQHTDKYLYFRTDHHWTARGAYYGYIGFAAAAGFSPVDIGTPSGKVEGFVGTLDSKVNGALKKYPDSVEYFMPQVNTEAVIYKSFSMTGGVHIPVVAESTQSTNKYMIFIDGDNALTKITTDAGTGRSLLILKDSFANALVPWLCNNYSEIYVVDPRWIPSGDLAGFVKDNNIGEVAVVNYIMSTRNDKYMKGLKNVVG